MGLDLHFSDKLKPANTASMGMGPLSPATNGTIDDAGLHWRKQTDYRILDNNGEGGFGEKPSIAQFHILISESADNGPTKNDFHFSTVIQNNYCEKRSNSIYELPMENCFFTANDELLSGSANKIYPKKSVRFSESTIFIERDMESPFWKELTDRKIRRRMLREQRRKRRLRRSMTLLDLLRILFSSSSGKKPNSVPRINQQNLINQENSLSRVVPVQDFNSNTSFSEKSSNPNIQHNESPAVMPIQFGQSGRKNSKLNKIVRSMQLWWSSSSQQPPSITSIQKLQIN